MDEQPNIKEWLAESKAAMGEAQLSVKEMREKFAQFDELNLKEKEGLNTQLEEIANLKQQVDAGLTSMNRTPTGEPTLSHKEELMATQSKEFMDWATKGMEYDEQQFGEIDPFMQKMLSSDNLRTGGHWMPHTMWNKIIEVIVRIDQFRQVATVVQLNEGDTLEGLYEYGLLNAAWTTERATPAEVATPEVDKWEIATHPMYVYPKITQKMARLSAFDVEQWLLSKYTNAFAYLEGYAFINGTGVGQPRGIGTVAAASTNISASSTTLPDLTSNAGVGLIRSGASATIPNFDCLKTMKASLLEPWQTNASWLMNRSTFMALDQLTDAIGHYFLQPDPTQASEGLLLGKPINFMYNMPVIGAGTIPILYGDFAASYIIVDAPGAFVIRDEMTDFGRISFKTERLGVGGDVVNYEAFKGLLVEA
jgi:phage major capsid protein, HK97 family